MLRVMTRLLSIVTSLQTKQSKVELEKNAGCRLSPRHPLQCVLDAESDDEIVIDCDELGNKAEYGESEEKICYKAKNRT